MTRAARRYVMATTLTRRRLLQYGAAGSAALLLPRTARAPAATAAAPGKLTKYLEPLPLPGNGIVVAGQSGSNHYSFTQTAISRQLHPELPPTPFWAYDDGSGLGGQAGSFGMAVVAESGTPVTIDFTHGPQCKRAGVAELGSWDSEGGAASPPPSKKRQS
jgi:hypothetical protein